MNLKPNPPERLFNVYCDESCHLGQRRLISACWVDYESKRRTLRKKWQGRL